MYFYQTNPPFHSFLTPYVFIVMAFMSRKEKMNGLHQSAECELFAFFFAYVIISSVSIPSVQFFMLALDTVNSKNF